MAATRVLSTLLASTRERILIIGRTPLAGEIAREIEATPASRQTLLGLVDDPPAEGMAPVYGRLLGPLSDLARIVDETHPDRVLVALCERRRRTPVRALVESCVARGITVEDAAEFYERMTGQLAIDCLTPTSLIYARRFGPSRSQQAFSRALSLIVAITGLVLLSPLLALIALAIKTRLRGARAVHPQARRPARASVLASEVPHDARGQSDSARNGSATTATA